MGMRRENFRNDEFYHIYNAGVEKMLLFKDKQDFFQFLQMLEFFNNTVAKGSIVNYKKKTLPKKKEGEKLEWNTEQEEKLVDIIAYALVKDHFHLILRQRVDNGIVKFMQKVSTGYAMYFNKKYKRTGSVYVRRFAASHIINNDELEKIGVYINWHHRIHKLKVESFKLVSAEDINKISYITSWGEYMQKSDRKICTKNFLLDRLQTTRKYKNFAEAAVLEMIEDKEIFLEK